MSTRVDHEWAKQHMQAYASGELPPQDEYRIQEHVQGCMLCAAELDELRSLGDLLRPGVAKRITGIPPTLEARLLRARRASEAGHRPHHGSMCEYSLVLPEVSVPDPAGTLRTTAVGVADARALVRLYFDTDPELLWYEGYARSSGNWLHPDRLTMGDLEAASLASARLREMEPLLAQKRSDMRFRASLASLTQALRQDLERESHLEQQRLQDLQSLKRRAEGLIRQAQSDSGQHAAGEIRGLVQSRTGAHGTGSSLAQGLQTLGQALERLEARLPARRVELLRVLADAEAGLPVQEGRHGESPDAHPARAILEGALEHLPNQFLREVPRDADLLQDWREQWARLLTPTFTGFHAELEVTGGRGAIRLEFDELSALLYLKRPALVPVVDDHVRRALGVPRTPGGSAAVFERLREVAAMPENVLGLTATMEWLGSHPEVTRYMALSRMRVLNIVAHMVGRLRLWETATPETTDQRDDD